MHFLIQTKSWSSAWNRLSTVSKLNQVVSQRVLSDFSIFFWLYGQHKCCSATSRSPLKTSHVYQIRISNYFPCLYISFQFQKMPHFHEVLAIFFKKLQKICR